MAVAIALVNASGAKTGATRHHDPFGELLGAVPDNMTSSMDFGWLGKHQRPLEHGGPISTIEMGARQYVPGLGRFLEVDPIEGGCATDYAYVFGDPINSADLDGRGVCDNRLVKGLINNFSVGNWFRDPPKGAVKQGAQATAEKKLRDELARRGKRAAAKALKRASFWLTAGGTVADFLCSKARKGPPSKVGIPPPVQSHPPTRNTRTPPHKEWTNPGYTQYPSYVNEAGVPNAQWG